MTEKKNTEKLKLKDNLAQWMTKTQTHQNNFFNKMAEKPILQITI